MNNAFPWWRQYPVVRKRVLIVHFFLDFPKILVFDVKFVHNNFNNIKLQAPDILSIALNTASLFLW